MPPRHAYVHVPFCARRCSYCDFAITVSSRVPVDEYLEALRSELALRYRDATSWTLDTLYFGGGTPSRLGGTGIARAIAIIRQFATLAPGCELTVEANPDDVAPDAVRAWRDAGVNRLSLGAQSFHLPALEWMHRTHDAAQIPRAMETARAAGLDNISLDLIYALPAALGRDWESDVRMALALAPAHLSLYGLTVELATPLAHWRDRGEVVEGGEDRYAEEFLLAHDALTGVGFEHYEVSNFARPGRRSRHNGCYWSGAPYAGLGPSAHEFDGTQRRWNVRNYSAWLARVAAGQEPREGGEELTPENRDVERVYLGLRTTDGIRIGAAEAEEVRPWVTAGWAAIDGEQLRLTPQGWLRLDQLAADLTSTRSR